MSLVARLVGSAIYTSHNSSDITPYRNVDSETFSTITHDDTAYTGYYRVGGFDFSIVPQNATVVSFRALLKMSAMEAVAPGIRPFYNGGSALDIGQVQPALSTSVRVFEYPITGISWSDFSSYGSNLRVNIPVDTDNAIYLYGVEIEVTYDLHCNKVVYGTTVLVDLTADTVTADTLMQGYTAHDKSGAFITGTATGGVGDSYTLTTILAQRTLNPDSQHWAEVTRSDWIEEPAVGEYYLVTFDGTEYLCTGGSMWSNEVVFGDDNNLFQNSDYMVPFAVDYSPSQQGGTVACADTNQHTIKIERFEFVDGPLTIIPKSITANGTYNASSDNADGYSSVTVNVPTGGGTPTLQAKTATPTTSQQVITADSGYDGLSQVTVNAIPSQYIVPSGNKAITANGNNIDVAEYATVSVNVSGSSKNVQVAQSTTRVANTAYTKTASLTCSVSGTYDVYWDCFRSTTSGTSGSQLYIGGTASGSANTTFSNHAQNNHRTGVQINADQEVAVYVRSRSTNYYAYCGQLTIVQTA